MWCMRTAALSSKVKQALADRIAHGGMEESFGEILVPTEEVVEMKAGKQPQERAQVLPRLRAGARWR